MKQPTYWLLAFGVLLSFAQCKPKANQSTTSTTTPTSAQFTKADESNITNREVSSWEFAKTKQLDKLNALLADDFQAFFGKILMSKADVIRNFQVSTINNYRLFNIRVKKISDDAAVIHYEALQNAQDQDGDKWVPNVAVSTVYSKRGNAWYPVFYHETPVARE
ncbi:MAG: hypothetical protein EOO06_15640 [Chitinophagaceae bacterium]|nr:MAG: hypothetical protein EOO06_15640 [Chitinophagaceae bacterium]